MNKFMKIAIAEALDGINNGDGGPFGACVVKDGVVIGKGHNRVLKKNNCTCHGEMEAIGDACRNLKNFDLAGAEIYTTGEPCPMCMGAIMWANIEKVYYGCSIKENSDIGFRDEAFYNGFNTNHEKMKCQMMQLDHKECYEVFKKYNSIKDKQLY